MRQLLGALGLLFTLALPARCHFVWILPDGTPGHEAAVRVVFSDSLKPDSPELLEKINGTRLWIHGRHPADDASAARVEAGGKDAFVLKVPGTGPRVVTGQCQYGVIQRGKSEPFLLMYYPNAFLGFNPGEPAELFTRAAGRQPLQLRLEAGAAPSLQVLWQNQPLAGAEVVVLEPGQEKGQELKTDAAGQVALKWKDLPPGLLGVRVRHVEARAGEEQGKKYQEVRHYATLVVQFAGKRVEGAEKDAPAEDPAASKLLADARAARAQWQHFPGFSADLEVNLDGQVSRGTVRVTNKGKVEVSVSDPAAEGWAKGTLASVVGHRIDNSASLKTPCAFADHDADHPLGQAIRVLNDEFHSSYRVRDRQIIVVNRRMGDSRFTITVVENRLNAEKKYLPACFVVNTWELQGGALKSSQAHHQTWQRVGAFDLPETYTVISAGREKQEARRLRLTNPQLLEPAPQP